MRDSIISHSNGAHPKTQVKKSAQQRLFEKTVLSLVVKPQFITYGVSFLVPQLYVLPVV